MRLRKKKNWTFHRTNFNADPRKGYHYSGPLMKAINLLLFRKSMNLHPKKQPTNTWTHNLNHCCLDFDIIGEKGILKETMCRYVLRASTLKYPSRFFSVQIIKRVPFKNETIVSSRVARYSLFPKYSNKNHRNSKAKGNYKSLARSAANHKKTRLKKTNNNSKTQIYMPPTKKSNLFEMQR